MAVKNNATCRICGKEYYICADTNQMRKVNPWKIVADSVEHYKIYLALHGYSVSKDKEKAKHDLESCDLSEYSSFVSNVKSRIDEIMNDDKPDEDKTDTDKMNDNKADEYKTIEVSVSPEAKNELKNELKPERKYDSKSETKVKTKNRYK